MEVSFTLRLCACVAGAASAIGLAACSTNLEGPGIDYRSDVSAKKASLEVPPDLTQVPRDERFSVPDAAGRSSATASQVQRIAPGTSAQAAAPASGTSPMVATANQAARIEREGNQRWIVVNQPPERVWQVVREFWIQNGFTYRVENREIGVLETNWAEDHAKMPKDLLRRTLGSIVTSLYDTGERDLFRTRIERSADGTEIYITHRGATEIVNATKDGTIWQPRPNDPNLEAEFLQRLLIQFGVNEAATKSALAAGAPGAATAGTAPPSAPSRAQLIEGDPLTLMVLEAFDRAWRRVGLALDRTGFTVEERDRLNGSYSVRYVEPEKPDDGGLFGSFFRKKADASKAQQFRIVVRADGASSTRVTMLDKEGKAVSPEITRRVLGLIADDLR